MSTRLPHVLTKLTVLHLIVSIDWSSFVSSGQTFRVRAVKFDREESTVTHAEPGDIQFRFSKQTPPPTAFMISPGVGEVLGVIENISSSDLINGTLTIAVSAVDGGIGVIDKWQTLHFVISDGRTALQQKAFELKQSLKMTKQIALGFGGLILVILLAVAAYKRHEYVVSMRPVDFDTQFALMVSMGLIEPEHVKVQMKPREIRRKDLTLVKVIGSGAFGEVYKAQLDEMFTRSTPEYTVAAKTVLDAKSSPEATREMLAEAGVMAAVGSHPNLVSLIGVITRGDPLVLILQFCAQGELLGMLKKAAAEGEPIALMDKMQMAREVAQGMSHLSKEHFIHRDLACRNVLYADGMCKIADFGLSRGGGGESTTVENEDAATHEDYYKSTAGVFPVRWTAPEAMETLRFTPASDVWSFGILVIELLVDGGSPYHGMSNPDVMKLTMSGGRHAKPPLCSNKLYAMLLKCWDTDAAQRPAFPQLCDAFKEMYTVSSKSADANAARVEAATIAKLKRGSAANQYSSFEDAPGVAPTVGPVDGHVMHNPLFDVDAFVDNLATAPTSASSHGVLVIAGGSSQNN
jgi:serine/threonine protein kinase